MVCIVRGSVFDGFHSLFIYNTVKTYLIFIMMVLDVVILFVPVSVIAGKHRTQAQ